MIKRKRIRYVHPDDHGKVDLTVYIAQPRTPNESLTIKSIPNLKACRVCQKVFVLDPKKVENE